MYYAPQPLLADWSSLTDEIVKANYEGEDEMIGVYERKERTLICQACGAEFTAKSEKAKWCPACNRKIRYERSNRIRASHKAAAAVTSVDPEGRTHGMSADDVPEVPADDYYSVADKIKKTAPIETCLVQHKEDNMDTDRAERLKTFPSLSNMTEHPEYFTQPTATTNPFAEFAEKEPTDNGTAKSFKDCIAEQVDADLKREIKKDRKMALLSLYKTLVDIAKDADMTVTELISRMTSLDAALS